MACCGFPQMGAQEHPILELASGELFHTHPQILPGGKAMLLQAVGTPPSQDNFTVDVVSHRQSRPQDTRARSRVSSLLVEWPSRVHEERDDVRRAVRPRADGNARGCRRGSRRRGVQDPVAYGAQYRRVTHRHVRVPAARWWFQPDRAVARYDGQAAAAPGHARHICRERPACRPMASASQSPFGMAAIRTSGSTSRGVMR